jgi:hypothetical protein
MPLLIEPGLCAGLFSEGDDSELSQHAQPIQLTPGFDRRRIMYGTMHIPTSRLSCF